MNIVILKRVQAILQVLNNQTFPHEHFNLHRNTLFKSLEETYSKHREDNLVLDYLSNYHYILSEDKSYILVSKGLDLLHEIWDTERYDRAFIYLSAKATSIHVEMTPSDLGDPKNNEQIISKVIEDKFVDVATVPGSRDRYKLSKLGERFWFREKGYTGKVAKRIENEFYEYKDKSLEYNKRLKWFKAIAPVGTISNAAIGIISFLGAIFMFFLGKSCGGG